MSKLSQPQLNDNATSTVVGLDMTLDTTPSTQKLNGNLQEFSITTTKANNFGNFNNSSNNNKINTIIAALGAIALRLQHRAPPAKPIQASIKMNLPVSEHHYVSKIGIFEVQPQLVPQYFCSFYSLLPSYLYCLC